MSDLRMPRCDILASAWRVIMTQFINLLSPRLLSCLEQIAITFRNVNAYTAYFSYDRTYRPAQDKAVGRLKRQGLIPAGNRTDPLVEASEVDASPAEDVTRPANARFRRRF